MLIFVAYIDGSLKLLLMDLAFLQLVCLITSALMFQACATQVTSVRAARSDGLVVHLFGDDLGVTRERVAAAAEAVGPSGTLILDYAPRSSLSLQDTTAHQGLGVSIEEALAGLPDYLRSRVYLSRFPEPYPWIRDSSFGWQKLADGKFRLNAAVDGNNGGTAFSAASVATLINACEGLSAGMPKLRSFHLQEGMLVSNGAGVCVANQRVRKRVISDDFFHDIGCDKVIYSLDWEDWRKQGHPNGHIDMSVAFVSPKVAVIPALESRCKTTFKTGWENLRDQLNAAGISTIEIPVASGCIGADAVVRSYSNMAITESSILIAKFFAPSHEMNERYDADNARAVEILKAAMIRGQIPLRKVIQFPIGVEIKGGSIHCMSINLPSSISNCKQSRLDARLHEWTDAGIAAAVQIKNEDHAHANQCAFVADTVATLHFIVKQLGTRSLTRLGEGETITVNPEEHRFVENAVNQISASIGSKCDLNAK